MHEVEVFADLSSKKQNYLRLITKKNQRTNHFFARKIFRCFVLKFFEVILHLSAFAVNQ